MPLDHLTAAQHQMLARVAERWTQVGRSAGALSTADRQFAAVAVGKAYTYAGLAPPATLIWMPSPLSGVLAAALLESVAHHSPQMGQRIGALVTTQVWRDTYKRVRNAIVGHVETPLWWQIIDQTMTRVSRDSQGIGPPILETTRADLASPRMVAGLWPQITQQLREALHDPFDPPDFVPFDRGLLYPAWEPADPDDLDDLDDVVVDITTLGGRTRQWVSRVRRRAAVAQAGRAYAEYVPGSFLADWAALTDACAELAIPGANQMWPLNKVAAVVGLWWPFQKVAVLSERPTVLQLDQEGRLHGDGGPAVAYADGWQLHRWHGLGVPQRLVTRPLSWQDWLAEAEPQWQQVIAERIGYQRLLAEAPDRIQVADDEYGILWRIPRSRDTFAFGDDRWWVDRSTDDVMVVEVLNSTPEPDGSIRRYVLRVPPEYGAPGARPRDAIGWTFGMADGEYGPAVMT